MSLPDVNVVLCGGPAVRYPDADRLRYLPDTASALKLERGDRYEHFEPTAETVEHDGRRLLVFAWTRHTYMAE
ncbi:DUF5988 family protein [Streptomyces sp. B1866]|uniref:DUF5988 family protein n=1 Tax=Streptomyces sp. B1866 TaxID=3075431 RepID=UPI00288FFFDF|nr:DUF5988 family protein [Streptomyces sp. B1866]MDT3399357.1 DUF5988 family protein [Streptomyces sp. B1866]